MSKKQDELPPMRDEPKQAEIDKQTADSLRQAAQERREEKDKR